MHAQALSHAATPLQSEQRHTSNAILDVPARNQAVAGNAQAAGGRTSSEKAASCRPVAQPLKVLMSDWALEIETITAIAAPATATTGAAFASHAKREVAGTDA